MVMAVKRGINDTIFEWIVRLLLVLTGVVILFPLFFVVSASITPYEEVMRNGGFVVIPRVITFEAYTALFKNYLLIKSFVNSLFITLVGTLCNMIATTLAAWPLSRKKLPGRSGIMMLVTFTLMFSGGIIPTYLVVKDVGLLDSLWSLIIPSLVWTTNLIILKNFMEALPEELIEASVIEGASDFHILVRIVVPLSIPILMTIVIYYGVGHWNEYFNAILYLTDRTKLPMQVIIRQMLASAGDALRDPDQITPTLTLQMAAIVIACLPVVLAYPFIQKAFTKGTMAGAVKG
jgi:putative aldouronate transport system permease protein